MLPTKPAHVCRPNNVQAWNPCCCTKPAVEDQAAIDEFGAPCNDLYQNLGHSLIFLLEHTHTITHTHIRRVVLWLHLRTSLNRFKTWLTDAQRPPSMPLRGKAANQIIASIWSPVRRHPQRRWTNLIGPKGFLIATKKSNNGNKNHWTKTSPIGKIMWNEPYTVFWGTRTPFDCTRFVATATSTVVINRWFARCSLAGSGNLLVVWHSHYVGKYR